MKIVLIVFCGLATLIAAGAAVVLLSFGDEPLPGLAPSPMLALIPAAVVMVNAVVLARLFRPGAGPSRALKGLAVFDAVALIAFLLF